ncbi:hypothetical protein BK124_11490 [Paenibacillus amylolyticus]|uniref:hypothetical protein n=1 Tax=Paenibacillus amylolyticus TaxID=1451 RepID=UPI00096D7E74|nr:hypothetical protein [Paenibacillus amylolyticus]OMF00273.1 hypothetical protein BK124_11490 [Paenibacillus amylolyticus]
MESCIGCSADRPSSEFKEMNGERLCKSCQWQERLMQEFSLLEDMEYRLIDEAVDLESDAEVARSVLASCEDRCKRKWAEVEANQLARANFDWSREESIQHETTN